MCMCAQRERGSKGGRARRPRAECCAGLSRGKEEGELCLSRMQMVRAMGGGKE